MKFWTDKEIEFIRNNYTTMNNGDLGKAIGRTKESVKHKLMETGCKRTTEQLNYVKHTKLKYQSRFKKGNMINTKQDGDITIRTRYNRKIKYIRLEMCKWEKYNNYLWKQKYGSIPDGMFVVEKNGISGEDVKSVDDLQLLTKSEIVKRSHCSRKKTRPKKSKTIPKLEKMIGRLYLYIYRYHRINGYHFDGNDVVIETDAREIRVDKTKLAHEITLFLPVDGSDSSGYKRPSDYKNQVSFG